MKILVTGANGVIASEVIKKLKSKSKILGIDIIECNNKNISYLDITNAREVENYFKRNKDIKYIIHSAALAHNKGSDLSFEKFKKVNFIGTKNLIDCANKYLKLKKFIFFSTISVYGERITKELYCEGDKLDPKTPYAITKKMSEDYLIKNNKFNYIILRFSPVYSENFTLNIDRRSVLKDFLYKIGDGNKKLSLLNLKNIPDVCEFFINSKKMDINNQVYNVSDFYEYTYNDLLKFQKKRLNKKFILYIPDFFIKIIYHIGKIFKSKFFIENSVKLVSNNIYSYSKISKIFTLKYALTDIVHKKS